MAHGMAHATGLATGAGDGAVGGDGAVCGEEEAVHGGIGSVSGEKDKRCGKRVMSAKECDESYGAGGRTGGRAGERPDDGEANCRAITSASLGRWRVASNGSSPSCIKSASTASLAGIMREEAAQDYP